MNEQEIKAWSMTIASNLYRPLPEDTKDKDIRELMDWLLVMAKPIADEIRRSDR
jgi:hypothetical protein